MNFVFNQKKKYLDQEDFTPQAIEEVKSMILGSSFKAMITGYHYDNTPFIQLSRRADFVKKNTFFCFSTSIEHFSRFF